MWVRLLLAAPICPSDGKAYVPDLKSGFCGFESHLGYHIYATTVHMTGVPELLPATTTLSGFNGWVIVPGEKLLKLSDPGLGIVATQQYIDSTIY
jgi:hypothetical protein